MLAKAAAYAGLLGLLAPVALFIDCPKHAFGVLAYWNFPQLLTAEPRPLLIALFAAATPLARPRALRMALAGGAFVAAVAWLWSLNQEFEIRQAWHAAQGTLPCPIPGLMRVAGAARLGGWAAQAAAVAGAVRLAARPAPAA
jgi:hypothetical protein